MGVVEAFHARPLDFMMLGRLRGAAVFGQFS